VEGVRIFVIVAETPIRAEIAIKANIRLPAGGGGRAGLGLRAKKTTFFVVHARSPQPARQKPPAGSRIFAFPFHYIVRRGGSPDRGRGIPWWQVMQFTTGAGPLSLGTFEM